MARRKFSLTTTEVAELKAAYQQSKDGDYNKKLLAVRLYGTGHSTASIIELVGCSRTSLMEWVQSYQQDGLECLPDQRRGGNHFKLSRADKEAVKRQVQAYTPRQLLGEACTSHSGVYWTAADLRLLVYQNYQVIYQSPVSYWTLLTECGLSYQRSEKVFKSNSALKIADFEEQLEKK